MQKLEKISSLPLSKESLNIFKGGESVKTYKAYESPTNRPPDGDTETIIVEDGQASGYIVSASVL